jgi:hypothetical protein
MSDVHIIFEGNDMVLELSELMNEITGEIINNAVVTVTLSDEAGAPVNGNSWPLPLEYIIGSDGIYRAILADTLALTPDARYFAELVADAGPGLRAKWVKDCVCRVRR